jgi:1,4-alpha-glucan branching enzyme
MKTKKNSNVHKTRKTTAFKAEKSTKSVAKEAKITKRRVTFTYRAEPGLKVYLAGTFNNWDADAKMMADKQRNGNYSATVLLLPGSYEYKFVINGTWCANPECADWVQNDHGTLNSVKHVE